MVWRGLEAAKTLEREYGIEAEVVNVAIIKPSASGLVLDSLGKTGVAVTAEEHRITGGLGDAIRQVAASSTWSRSSPRDQGRVRRLRHCQAGIEHFGLTATGIATSCASQW